MKIKMPLPSKKYKKISFLFVALFFAFVSTVGMYACTAVLAHAQMNNTTHTQMAMTECMYSPGDASCNMDLSEHTEGWQVIANALLAPNIFTLLLAVALLVWLFFGAFRSCLFDEVAKLNFTLYKKAHPNIRLYSYFSQLFSNGILQPKLYA